MFLAIERIGVKLLNLPLFPPSLKATTMHLNTLRQCNGRTREASVQDKVQLHVVHKPTVKFNTFILILHLLKSTPKSNHTITMDVQSVIQDYCSQVKIVISEC